jgi:CheY-like chemotaxis protein
LERLGHEVIIADNGARALQFLCENAFDAVFMDCHMPVLDGYEATKRLRSGDLAGVDANIPVIALTASAMVGDRAKCLEAGMNEYVAKPVKVAELKNALRRCGF